MIRFEINELPFAITNDQFATLARIVSEDWSLNYDVVEQHDDDDGTICVWAHPDNETDNPLRHHILIDGTILLTEEVDWDWKGTS